MIIIIIFKKLYNNNIFKLYLIFKEFENPSVEKKDAFDFAGIRAQVFGLLVECSQRKKFQTQLIIFNILKLNSYYILWKNIKYYII